MIIDAATLDATAAYKLLIGIVVPRAIGWISTLSTNGVANLAPFSFFTVVGRKPPMVSVSIQPRSDGVTLKDTFVNIRDTGEFVTNLTSLAQADAMHRSSFEYPSDVDEFEAVGLAKAPSVVVRPPRVEGAPVSMECKLERIIPMGTMGDHVIFGEVVRFHIHDDLLLERGRVDTAAMSPVGRLAAEYTLVDNVFTTPLDPAILEARAKARMRRLDGYAADFSPIDQKSWSPSGALKVG